MKLKLNTTGKSSSSTGAGSPAPPSAATPTPSSTGGFKLKIRTSAPPTPAGENAPLIQPVEPLAPPPTKPKRAYNRKPKDGSEVKKTGKRAAEADISPAPKRPAIDEPKRRISFKISGNNDSGLADEIVLATPTSAAPKLKLAPSRRSSAGPKAILLTAKKRPPPRPIGVGYDSEASDAETDPAIEQQFVLRMPDPSTFDDETIRSRVSEDATYLRTAIEEKRIGLSPGENGADVSFRFVSRDLRRAVVTIRGTRYTAMLVDLPCVVESLKSWDRRGGWWKVADLAQLLLVLAPIPHDDDADQAATTAQRPPDVDAAYRYAHGLTPPMHYVRRRRFRKRVSHRDIETTEDAVEALLRQDKECLARGGDVAWKVYDDALGALSSSSNAAASGGNGKTSFSPDADADADSSFLQDAANSVTAAATPSQLDDDDDELMEADLLAGLENMQDDDDDDAEGSVVDDDAPPASAVAAVDAATRSSSLGAASTPRPAAQSSSDEDESDDSDNDDRGGGGAAAAVDEDALAEANERAAQREEIADLEREVRNKRVELERVTNQLLRQRVRGNLQALEDELDMKRKAFGMEDEDSEGEDEEE